MAGDRHERRNAGIRLGPRDRELLVALLLHRAMSRQHLQERFFGSVSRANYRLAQLRRYGLIRVIDVPFAALGAMTVYVTTKLAARVIGPVPELGEIPPDPPESISNLDHTLKIGDVALALHQAARRGELTLVDWRPEIACYHEFQLVSSRVAAGQHVVRPDGFFAIDINGRELRAFVEVDCGTVGLPRIERKLRTYGIYRGCGAYADVYGPTGFAVAFVTCNERRLGQLLATAEAIGARVPVWGTTFGALRSTGLTGPIWRAAGIGAGQLTVERLPAPSRPDPEELVG